MTDSREEIKRLELPPPAWYRTPYLPMGAGLSMATGPQIPYWSDEQMLAEHTRAEQLAARVAVLEQMDSEAANEVEAVICMRTHFTGNPPYVGWKGLGLALTETLDERDQLRTRAERAEQALRELVEAIDEIGSTDSDRRKQEEATERWSNALDAARAIVEGKNDVQS